MTVGLGLLSTIDADTHFGLLSVFMAVMGIGDGMLMQNLVLAAQNDVPAAELGAAKGLEQAGVSAVSGQAAGHGVPDMTTLPAPMREIVEHAYGVSTGDLFLVATPPVLFWLRRRLREASISDAAWRFAAQGQPARPRADEGGTAAARVRRSPISSARHWESRSPALCRSHWLLIGYTPSGAC